MKLGALVLFVALAAGGQAAELPSFDFKTNVFPLPSLKLADGLKNKAPATTFGSRTFQSLPPAMTFNSSTFPNGADRFGRTSSPRFDPKMRIVKPRSDIDFKLIVKERDPNLDPKFVVPAPQPPVKLGGGK